MSSEGFLEYKIGGVSILFPCKPYPSQFSMMDKIIKGIERRQNCLLESPTGSGKSLALLCSTLAWQRAEKEKLLKEEEHEQMVQSCSCSCHTGVTTAPSNKKTLTQSACSGSTNTIASPYFQNGQETDKPAEQIVVIDDDDDDDFKQDEKKSKTLTSKINGNNTRKHISISYDNGHLDTGQTPLKPVNKEGDGGSNTNKCISPEDCQMCSCKEVSKSEKQTKRKIPKIYFGTRTHKQVAQIVRELRKTAYSDTRMTILASREHTCIHPVVSRSSNKNEGCQELLNGPGCSLSEKAKRVSSHIALNSFGLVAAWDLEDIIDVLKKKKACPYFVTKGLKDCSDLIICPYNYLVDPVIRKSMEISLKHNIVILDEGHNIEDSAREAGSQTVLDSSLSRVVTELDALIEANIKLADHLTMKTMCTNLEMFIHQESENLEQKDFDRACKIWSGFDIVAQMNNMKMGPNHFRDLQRAYNSICEEEEDQLKNTRGEVVKIGSASRQVLEQIFTVLDYMYRHDLKFVEDYRVAVLRTMSYSRKSNQPTNSVWLMSKKNRRDTRPNVEVNFSLNFWCMNPAVAFSDFADCRCLVLTSGTLSPTSSFQSELGLAFPIQLEANHVIKDNQIWVGAVGQGPTGSLLQAVYRNVETFAFQDELGELILRVCETVPHGVLCFLSSYKMLEKVQDRWKTTGLWRKILKKKKIISEPRASDKLDFEELMKYFYKVVETGQDSDDSDGEGDADGALFLAVCRGKVSEGLDFADNFARAVITVGIPYPNFKDIQVELKRKYNDENRSRGLLSGSDWYEIQAFRALNQALGRCIRHRKDWGALILVDDRFVKHSQKYCKGLSKWVRNKTQTFHNFNQAMESLAVFTKNRIEDSEKEKPDTSFFPRMPNTPSSQPNIYQEPASSPRTPFHKLNTSDCISPPNGVNILKSATNPPPESGFVTPTRRLPSVTPLISSASAVTPELMIQRVKTSGQTFLIPHAGLVPGQKSIFLQGCSSPASTHSGVTGGQGTAPRQDSLLPQQLQTFSSNSQLVFTPVVQQAGGHHNSQIVFQQVPFTNKQMTQSTNPNVQSALVTGQQVGASKPEQSQITHKLKEGIDKNHVKHEQNGLFTQPHDGRIGVHDFQSVNSKQNLKTTKSDVSKGAQGIEKFFKSCNRENTNLTTNNSVITEKTGLDSCRDSAGNRNVNIDTKTEVKSSELDRSDAVEKCSESPLLFEGSSQSEPSLDVRNQELAKKNLSTDQTSDEHHRNAVESCKKPLFRRKSSVSETENASDTKIEMKLGSEKVKTEADLLNKSEEIDKNKEIKSKDRNGNMEADVLIKLEDKSDENSTLICSDEEFDEPVIKRRSARQNKRKSDSMLKLKNKKHKGIHFLDAFEVPKEKEQRKLECCACGSVLVEHVKEFEKQKGIPSFLQGVVEKKSESVIHFTTELPTNMQAQTSNLQSGVELNCLWSEEHKACIQYLKCSTCKPGSVDDETVGYKVAFSSDTDLKTGETWLLSSMVKLT